MIAMATLLIAASIAPVASSPAPRTPLDALDSVFVVSTPVSQGASFVVSDRLLVTAAHVVEDVNVVELQGTQDPPVRLRANVVFRDRVEDVAILRTVTSLEQAPLDLRSAPVAVGDEVFAAGSPIDGVVLSKGRVSRADGLEGITSSTPVDPGNSGGPLLDASGAVVGMVYAQSIPAGDAYSVPTEILQQAIATAESQPEPVPTDNDSAAPSSSVTPVVLGTFIISTAALVLALISLVFAIGTRRRQRHQAPPITITLPKE